MLNHIFRAEHGEDTPPSALVRAVILNAIHSLAPDITQVPISPSRPLRGAMFFDV